jgi:hypothetical protein
MGQMFADKLPDFLGLTLDAQTALNYITLDPVLSKTPIVCARCATVPKLTLVQILYGQSIGGAVAIDLASRNPSKVKLPISYFPQLTPEHSRFVP